ncbi:hypothetical protein GCM10022242_02910 [Nocardioides panacisoli]|uniref:Uncharacterized protein n=1 Tax=Nocardioides panacisoli TaxID=627624 RepID=A0ABP7HSI0_9ACTN
MLGGVGLEFGVVVVVVAHADLQSRGLTTLPLDISDHQMPRRSRKDRAGARSGTTPFPDIGRWDAEVARSSCEPEAWPRHTCAGRNR